jgi:Ni,Fe-hydrogenase III small subunit
MRRFGVEFTSSPRHADGIVLTGPLTVNMMRAVEITLEAVPEPKIIIAAGTDAISGGLFADSPAVDRGFFERHPVDLYVPGNPVHPMTFITGLQQLLKPLPKPEITPSPPCDPKAKP